MTWSITERTIVRELFIKSIKSIAAVLNYNQRIAFAACYIRHPASRNVNVFSFYSQTHDDDTEDDDDHETMSMTYIFSIIADRYERLIWIYV